jgi:hypothetical protein
MEHRFIYKPLNNIKLKQCDTPPPHYLCVCSISYPPQKIILRSRSRSNGTNAREQAHKDRYCYRFSLNVLSGSRCTEGQFFFRIPPRATSWKWRWHPFLSLRWSAAAARRDIEISLSLSTTWKGTVLDIAGGRWKARLSPVSPSHLAVGRCA